MKTRIELWKDYREEIEKNISLQNSVLASNEQLNILHGRLLKVFPEFEEKHVSKLSKFEAKTNEIEQSPNIEIETIEDLISEINKIEEADDTGFSSIDNLSFESDELVDTLKSISEGRISKIKYVGGVDEDIKISQTQVVQLGVKMHDYRIAIDGPSGSGKSTVAKEIAKKYNLKYINTGLVYRAIALYILNSDIEINNESAVSAVVRSINIKLLKNEITELNGVEVTDELRSDKVSQAASIVASYSEVRKYAVEIQQTEAKRKGVIMDGRDTTFKTMADADVKIFLDTSPEVRAKRRQEQNERLGFSTNYDEILSEIKIRDERDRTREVDPLHKTQDAILIDASNMTINQVVDKIVEIIESK